MRARKRSRSSTDGFNNPSDYLLDGTPGKGSGPTEIKVHRVLGSSWMQHRPARLKCAAPRFTGRPADGCVPSLISTGMSRSVTHLASTFHPTRYRRFCKLFAWFPRFRSRPFARIHPAKATRAGTRRSLSRFLFNLDLLRGPYGNDTAPIIAREPPDSLRHEVGSQSLV